MFQKERKDEWCKKKRVEKILAKNFPKLKRINQTLRGGSRSMNHKEKSTKKTIPGKGRVKLLKTKDREENLTSSQKRKRGTLPSKSNNKLRASFPAKMMEARKTRNSFFKVLKEYHCQTIILHAVRMFSNNKATWIWNSEKRKIERIHPLQILLKNLLKE